MTTVLITGANRGIGLEFVRQYAGSGAEVLACCRVPSKAKELFAIAGNIHSFALDVTSADQVAALGNDLRGQAIDIVISNAGIYGPKHQDADNMDYAGWAETFAINSIAPLRLATTLHANLKKGAGKKFIAMTSRMGSMHRHDGTYFAYRSSKAALNSVAHGLSKTWARDGITVIAMHPGWVKTDMGGRGALLTPAESISNMRKVIDRIGQADSGKFLDHTGEPLPW